MTDPLHRGQPLDYRVELPILGVPTSFEVEDERLLSVVESTFGAWRSVSDRDDLISESTASVRLWLHDGPDGAGTSAAVFRMPRPDLLLLSTAGCMGVAELERGASVGYVTREMLDEPARLSEEVIQPLALVLVARPPRIAYHAAAVGRGDRAVLLAAPSGTGKSTLAWACAGRGLHVLTEDVAYLEARASGGSRVWGSPGPVRIPEDSLRFFPGVGADHPSAQLGGRWKRIVPLPQPMLPPVAERAAVCLLASSEGPPRLEAISPEEILAESGASAEAGFDFHADFLPRALGPIARAGGWRLHLGSDPFDAADLVAEALELLG